VFNIGFFGPFFSRPNCRSVSAVLFFSSSLFTLPYWRFFAALFCKLSALLCSPWDLTVSLPNGLFFQRVNEPPMSHFQSLPFSFRGCQPFLFLRSQSFVHSRVPVSLFLPGTLRPLFPVSHNLSKLFRGIYVGARFFSLLIRKCPLPSNNHIFFFFAYGGWQAFPALADFTAGLIPLFFRYRR